MCCIARHGAQLVDVFRPDDYSARVMAVGDGAIVERLKRVVDVCLLEYRVFVDLCFNSRVPRRTRPHRTAQNLQRPCFNSRVPRRTRRRSSAGARHQHVSTHASREGRDLISRIHRYDNTQRRVCATVRGGVGLMGLCGAEARKFTRAARRADIWRFLCELGGRASVLHKHRRPVR